MDNRLDQPRPFSKQSIKCCNDHANVLERRPVDCARGLIGIRIASLLALGKAILFLTIDF